MRVKFVWWCYIIIVSQLLTGCVPSSKTDLSSSSPHIEPQLDGLLDEAPIWVTRPVVANAQFDADGRRYHRVRPGDTGIAIAQAYGVRWSTIVKSNNLSDPFVLRIGQLLLVPGQVASNIEARAAAFRIDIDDIATGSSPAGSVVDPSSDSFTGRFIWPLEGAIIDRFGPAGEGRVNRGIEIATSPGSDIRAAADGTVAFVGNGGSAGYGGLILVRHGDGWISVYGRATTSAVKPGQSIKAGDLIGRVNDEASLHFQLRRNRTAVDPVKYLPPR